MATKRYILHPGYPGQFCYVGIARESFVRPERLAKEYGVDLSECYVYDSELSRLDHLEMQHFIHLRPTLNGVYNLPKLTTDQIRRANHSAVTNLPATS